MSALVYESRYSEAAVSFARRLLECAVPIDSRHEDIGAKGRPFDRQVIRCGHLFRIDGFELLHVLENPAEILDHAGDLGVAEVEPRELRYVQDVDSSDSHGRTGPEPSTSMPSWINEDQPHRDPLGHEVEIDDEVTTSRPRASSVTWIVLAAGLALTLVLAKFGIWFLFLPLIFPFGLGGRSLFRRAPSRRRLRLEGSVLLLERDSAAGSSGEGALDVSGGVFITVVPTGLVANGTAEAVVRIVSQSGALEILVSDIGRARRLKQNIADMLERSAVRFVERTTPLQGGVFVHAYPNGEELEWERRRTKPWAGRGRTMLRVDEHGWTLRVHSGFRVESSTGGPGLPQARLSTNERANPFESGVVERESVLELSWEGDVVARIGGELSEPELRFIAKRLERAQPIRRLAR